MGHIRIGTCSWKYDSWRGLVYSNKKPLNYLKEYSRKYNTVEIDQWFWSLFGINKIALPIPSVVNEYVKSVPSEFKFTIKIPNSITLTHFYKKTKQEPLIINPYFLSPELFKEFFGSIEKLKDQIGLLMFQFEYLNKQKMESQKIFQDKFKLFLEQIYPDIPYGLEIRNPNYLNNSYFEFLQKNNLAHVFLQGYYMPKVSDIYRQFKQYITSTTIIRLHGPDRSEIEKKSAGNWDKILEPKEKEL